MSLAITIKLDTSAYHVVVIAQFDGRYDDLKVFDYDRIEKELTYEYDAADNDDPLYGGTNENIEFQCKFKSKFKFINGRFIEIEKCEFLVKRE